MSVCYVGLGSNLGDREKYIRQAIERIKQIKGTLVVKVSSMIETKPVSAVRQGDFLNAVAEIKTDLSPRELLNNLQNIELDLGRSRTIKDGPRTIDLDILTYGDKKIYEVDLVIPHPRMMERDFVLRPLKEIAPDIVKRMNYENN